MKTHNGGWRYVSCSVVAYALICVAVVFATTSVVRAQELHVEVPTAFTLGEPVTAVLTNQNTTTQPVTIDLGQDRTRGLVVNGTKPNGENFSSSLPPRDGLSMRPEVSIPSGGAHKQELLLNAWLTFDQVGTYQLLITIPEQLSPRNGLPLSSSVSVQVTPRDVYVLLERASKLTEVILTSKLAQEQLDAERALARIIDPDVVPYLKTILEHTPVSDSVILAALGRVGTVEAMNILNQAASSANAERAAIARDVINRPEVYRFRP
jgi:hypothetical protein